jgi:hypothetical protein
MIATSTPFSQYFDKNGDPLDNGSVYFGVADQNPETSPVPVYWDFDGTQPIAQPVRTLAGYMVRNGSPANVFVDVAYSTTVRNKRGELVYYAANSQDFSSQSSGNTAVDAITNVDADALRLENGQVIIAKGRSSATDGAGGIFRYTTATIVAIDGGIVFEPAVGTGRLIRLGHNADGGFDGQMQLEWWGILKGYGNDGTANFAAINAAFDYLTTYGGYMTAGIGVIKVSAKIRIENFASFIFEGAGPPRFTVSDGIQASTSFLFPAGVDGFEITRIGSPSAATVQMRNFTVWKTATDTKGSLTIGFGIYGVARSEFSHIFVTGFDTDYWIDGIAGGTEVYATTFRNLTGYSAGTNVILIGGVADVHFYDCKFGGNEGALDTILKLQDGIVNTPDSVHFHNCLFIPFDGQTTNKCVWNVCDRLGWCEFTACVFEGWTSIAVHSAKSVSTYDVGNIISLMFSKCWWNRNSEGPAGDKICIYLLNTNAQIIGNRIQTDGGSAIVLDTTGVSAETFLTNISENLISCGDGYCVEGYKQDGLIVKGNHFNKDFPGTIGPVYAAPGNRRWDIRGNINNTSLPYDIQGTEHTGDWSGFTSINPGGPPIKIARFTGSVDGSGNADIVHGLGTVGNKLLMATCYYEAAPGIPNAMAFSYIDGTICRFTGGVSGKAYRATLTLSEDTAGW